MPASRVFAPLALLAGILLPVLPVHADDPTPGDLRRGLLAFYRDGEAKSVRQLEPTIALALKSGEAPDPRLNGKSETVSWKGYLNIVRGGDYRFSVRLQGKFTLSVGGKKILEGKTDGDKPELVEGDAVRLEPGVQTLAADYERTPRKAARVEVLWQGPQFRAEPLNQSVLGHLPTDGPDPGSIATEEGRFLAEEMNCIKCHRAPDEYKVAKTLAARQGPDLSDVGKRIHAGWIERWLESPRKLRPSAVMPEMFADEDVGKIERHAVAAYLSSLGGPVPATKEPAKKDLGSITRGQKLFTSAGCIACHGPYPGKGDDKKDAEPTLYGAPKIHPLVALGSKTTVERLAEYLSNPLAHDPSGRMPNMLLQGGEATDLARFLCESADSTIPQQSAPPDNADKIDEAFKRLDNRPEELAAFKKLPADAQWKDLGKRLVIDKGCNNCHKIEPGGRPFASVQASAGLDDLKKSGKAEAGCLAEKADKRGKAPKFPLSEADRAALRTFLSDGLTGAGSPAPGYAARVEVRRFNCLACHTRDSEGGLPVALVEELRKFEKAENGEAVSPPTLTGVAHKLRTPWMREVLTKAGRARPWMGLRMPQFGEANVGRLPEMLAALEGTEPDDTIHKTPTDSAKIQAGRKLVGKQAFGCISCHDLAGIPNSGTRGPDLAGMNQRVRYEWYERWLEQPQRIQPGTRMPDVFAGGKSLLPSVLDGSAPKQADAIWAYLALGPTLPLPEGMEPPKGLTLYVTDRPIILRTFMPDDETKGLKPDAPGTRAIAVGYPGGVSASFDAHTCRLSYAWSGQFLDARPVWDGRGGNPAKLMGPKFWTAPVGCPVAATDSSEPPDFLSRANDPAYGGTLPEGKLFKGVTLLHFDGYGLDEKGAPTFHYHLTVGENEDVKVSERVEPLRAPAGVGLGRRFVLDVPAKQTAWVFVGESNTAPMLLAKDGEKKVLDLKDGINVMPAAGHTLLLPLAGERVALLSPSSMPEGSQWRVQQIDKKWQVLLRPPTADKATTQRIDVNIWVPHRDEAALLKELLEAK
jgi:mono/diheme cytochrome c family protein